jgi:hypothetical protein
MLRILELFCRLCLATGAGLVGILLITCGFIGRAVRCPLIVSRNLGTVWPYNLKDDYDFSSVYLNSWGAPKLRIFRLIPESQSFSLTRMRLFENLEKGLVLLFLSSTKLPTFARLF